MIGAAAGQAVTLIGSVEFRDSATAVVSIGVYGEGAHGLVADMVTWVVVYGAGRWAKIGEGIHVVQ
jgi:hypothetical protein